MESRLFNINILKQHNKVTEARYEMSALEKNIVYMLMAQFRDDDLPKKKYFVSIQELKQKLKKYDQEVSLEQIQVATYSLISRVYSFENEEKGSQIDMTLFASVTYKDNSDFIEIELSRKVRPYLFDLKFDFTTYKLDVALSLRSKYSKRIYEMLSQYKDVGVFNISVLKLKEMLKIIDPATKTEKFKMWSVFTKSVLEVAKKEINEKADLSFTYTLKKTGPKYTEIAFDIFKNEDSFSQKIRQAQLQLDF